MGYYITKEDGLIQASLAHRIGQLLNQYDAAKPEGSSERYDATLALVLSQALLTSCYESLMRDDLPQLSEVKGKKLTDVPSLFGLKWGMVSSFYPGEESPTFFDVIKHLRTAVSHPLFPKDESSVKETGFMAVKGIDGKVAAFKFIQSEDVKVSGGTKINKNVIYKTRGDDTELKDKVKKRKSGLSLPRPVQGRLSEVDFPDRVELHFDRQLLMRVFEMEIPVANLKEFVRELSAILSAPLKDCSVEDANVSAL